MNNLNLSQDKVNALLGMAAKKLGKSPDELKKQLQSGDLNSLAQNMDANASGQINKVLNDPKALEALLQNEKIKALLGSLGRK